MSQILCINCACNRLLPSDHQQNLYKNQRLDGSPVDLVSYRHRVLGLTMLLEAKTKHDRVSIQTCWFGNRPEPT